ncbi:MAG: TonB-dependent receptor [Sphingobacteriales bacterium]|nr:MAG: TonB-dependent receptor [Sphingobacteriales bacterium]
MKYFYGSLILFIICLPVTLFAQSANNSLAGSVTDTAGLLLAGVVISLPDLKTGTATDANGRFTIDHLPKGNFLVQVKMLGFSTITQNININGTTEQQYRLQQGIIEKGEIIVTGTSLATEERKSVTPIQSISIKEMRENASTNIIDAIAKLPGVSQLSTGPAISKPIIRGLGYNRIITLNDNIRQEGQQWGDEHGIEIDDYNVSRVEVLKGPASLAYGSDALAGVVNIISDDPAPLGTINGNVTANYQTNNGMAAVHAQTGGNINGINWNVYGTGKQAHDYQNAYDGFVHNSRFSNLNYGAAIGINKKWGYSRLSFTSFNQNLGIVEGERDSATGRFMKLINDNGEEAETIATDDDGHSYSKQLPRQEINHQKIAWNNNLYLNNGGRIGLTLGYQQNSRKEFEDVPQPDVSGLHFLLNTYNYDARYYLPVMNGWNITAGINGMQQNSSNKGDEFLIPGYTLSDAGMYAIARKDWQKWTVSGGLRLNYRNMQGNALYLDSSDAVTDALQPGGFERFSNFSRTYTNLAGSIGAAYNATKSLTWKFNVASGFRGPNIAELSANGVHEGTIRYEYGNLALKAEQSVQADAGLSLNTEHVLVNASIFYNHISNFIYLRKLLNNSGADSIPAENNEEGYVAFSYDQQTAALYGGELYIDFHPHPLDWLHLENTISYVRGIIPNAPDSMRNLPYIPAARWLVELRANKTSLGKYIKNAYAKVGLDITFAQNNAFTAFDTETPTSAYTLLNAGIGLDVVNKNKTTLFTLAVSGQNLGDVAYQNHLSRLKYGPENFTTGRNGVYNVGRNISLMLSVPLNFK